MSQPDPVIEAKNASADIDEQTCPKCGSTSYHATGNQIIDFTDHFADGRRVDDDMGDAGERVGQWQIVCNECGHKWSRRESSQVIVAARKIEGVYFYSAPGDQPMLCDVLVDEHGKVLAIVPKHQAQDGSPNAVRCALTGELYRDVMGE